MSLYAISIYESIFYTYPLGVRDLEVNENSNPEESLHLRALFEKRGCEPEVCGCAMWLMYRSSSRAERVLLAYNSDYLKVLLMQTSYALPVRNGLKNLGLSDDQISEVRQSGKIKFTSSLQSCIGK
jgi:hypothetical protein